MAKSDKQNMSEHQLRIFGSRHDGDLGCTPEECERYHSELERFEHRGELARAHLHGLAQTGQKPDTLKS